MHASLAVFSAQPRVLGDIADLPAIPAASEGLVRVILSIFGLHPFQNVPRGERTNTFCSCSKSKNIFSHLQISGQIATVPTPELREFWGDSLSITTIWGDYSAVLSL